MKNGWYKEGNVFKLYFNDQLIETSNTDPKLQTSSQTPEQKEGVPPMAYKPGMEPIKGETHSEWLLRTTGNPGVVNNTSKWDGTKWVDSTGTTTSAATTGEMSAEEKAVRDFATAKGQNPDEVWQNYQMITSSYGTMGAGTQQPYGYGVSGMVPYRYKHRGYGPIGWDRGYVPGVGDLAAMQEQANRMGYEFYGKSRPTLFGGRKVVIKTHYNPATGKVENKPTVADETPAPVSSPAPTWGVQPQTPSPLLTLQDRYNLDKEKAIQEGLYYQKDFDYQKQKQIQEQAGIPLNEPVIAPEGWITDTPVESNVPTQPVTSPVTGGNYDFVQISGSNPPMSKEEFMKGKIQQDLSEQKYGGLMRFLPKHQVLGETGFKFDNLDINVPIMDTFHNIKTGLTSINDFKQQRADARREKRGTDEKAVWKTGPSPYAADTLLTGMSALTNIARGKKRKALQEQMATGKLADNLFTSVEKKRGDYVPTGQEYGMFRPDQTIPIFDTGYDKGYANRPTYSYDRGGSIAYSDWSQTPVNGYYGVPQGEFSPYSSWSQSPVKMQSGGAMMQDGVYDLSEDEINAIIQAGGQVEFLD